MKKRKGFISNSSSTSFIVARKVSVSEDPYLVNVSFTFDIRDISSGIFVIKTIEELEKYILKSYSDHAYLDRSEMKNYTIENLPKSFQDLYHRSKGYIESGYILFYGISKSMEDSGQNLAEAYLSNPEIKAEDVGLFFLKRDYNLDEKTEDDLKLSF